MVVTLVHLCGLMYVAFFQGSVSTVNAELLFCPARGMKTSHELRWGVQ